MNVIERIAAERQRQIDAEGYSIEHDDEHGDGSLAMAAACYAAPIVIYKKEEFANSVRFSDPWPWEQGTDSRYTFDGGNVLVDQSQIANSDRVRNLEKAAALIVAEIERLERGGLTD